MNVAIFTDNHFGNVNGVTTSLSAALRHAPPGIAPRIYTEAQVGADRPEYLSLASIGVGMPFYRGMKMYFPRLLAMLKRVQRDRIDLIHLTTPGPVGLAALFVAWRTGLRMVGSFHTDLASYTALLSGSPRLGALMREYLRWPYGRCDRILVPSKSTKEILIAAKMDPRKLRLWTRGIDTTLFTPVKRTPALRERWHVDARRPAILYVGRLSHEKGLGVLPAFQSALHRRGIEHRLILVGEGPMRDELHARCPDAIFTGALSRDEVAACMASADVFIFPSETDAAGNVVLEAQASGLPVVVSDAGGPREYMVPGVTGVAHAARDIDGFAHEVARLVRDQGRRHAMADAARNHALTLTWERALEPLYRAYREVASGAAGPDFAPTSRSSEARRNVLA